MNKDYDLSKTSGFFLGANDSAWGSVLKILSADNVVFSYVAGSQKVLNGLEDENIQVKQELVDLFRGRIVEIDFANDIRVDSDTLSIYLEAEQICMEICDRMDQSYSFSRQERERLYIGALGYWLIMVERNDPQFIIFTQTPHSVYEYVLYAVAKKQGIPVQMYLPLTVFKRVLPYNDYKNIGEKVISTYLASIKSNQSLETLPEDIQSYLDAHSESYSDVMPKYLRDRISGPAKRSMKEWFGMCLFKLGRIRSYPEYFRSIFLRLYYVFIRSWDKYFTNRPPNRNYLKQPNEAIEATIGLNRRQWRNYKRRARTYKIALQNSYDGHCKQLDIAKKYVYVPLAFQPEKTTTPEGGRYSNQLMMIRLLSSCLPSGWEVVVKENPSQLLPDLLHGERGRYLYYYDDLAKIANVRIVSIATDQFKLIDNCAAVATITGTTGWEAIVRSKPTLCFGYAWYQGCDGVFKVKNKNDCLTAIKKIRTGIKVSQENVHRFLLAVDRHTFRGFTNLRRYPAEIDGAEITATFF